MEKDHDPSRKKSRQHPGKKPPIRDQNQPPLTQFFPRLNSDNLSVNYSQILPNANSTNFSINTIMFIPSKEIKIKSQFLLYISFQTCDSKPLIPSPRPPKPSEMCQGSALVSIRDDAYWESLDRRLMPQCYQQAIVAIESPVITPVIAILSTAEKGRCKRWFTSINRDSSTRFYLYDFIALCNFLFLSCDISLPPFSGSEFLFESLSPMNLSPLFWFPSRKHSSRYIDLQFFYHCTIDIK